MQWIVVTAAVIGLLLGSTGSSSAEEPKTPSLSTSPALPGEKPIGTPMPPEALMGLLGGFPRPGVTAPQAQTPYPMFQLLGPSLAGDAPINVEMMGDLLLLQGELMIKMGEVMMKYGQKISDKGK
jgi:hypothetical protein